MLPDDSNNSQHPQPNFFVLIPSHILDDERVDGETAILFGRIASLSNNKGFCWASDKYLAELTRTSDRQLRRRMKTLEDCGYIKKETEKHGMYWTRKIYPNFNRERSSNNVYERSAMSAPNGHPCPFERSPMSEEQDKHKHNKDYISSCCDSQAAQRVDEEKPKDPSIDKAELLARKIKANNPKAQIPESLTTWARDIERMHRIDGYSYEEIEALIEYSQQDAFWSSNVLSAQKLRKQAGTLTMRMKGDKAPKPKQSTKKSEPVSGFREPTPEEMKYHDGNYNPEDRIKEIAKREGWVPFGEAYPELFKKNE